VYIFPVVHIIFLRTLKRDYFVEFKWFPECQVQLLALFFCVIRQLLTSHLTRAIAINRFYK